MTDERFRRAKSLFIAALDLSEEARAELLTRECAGDADLRREVESLLHAQRQETMRTGGACAAAGLAEATDTVDPDIASQSRLGRYRLLERLGQGAFGEVWLAEEENPVRPKVAVKIIKPGMDTREVLARFDAERRALAIMDHPGVARVTDAGATERGRPYFVMEHVPGVPITRYCDDARLPVRRRLELFVEVCRAVEHAHQKGIIHRDLKPQNILVSERGGRAVPKVIDFGVAKAMFGDGVEDGLATEVGRGVGTLEYMPPEQTGRLGLDVDVRADVYALGAVLYELLTGTPPLDLRSRGGASLEALAATICDTDPPLPSARLSSTGAATGAAGSASTFADTRNEDLRTLIRLVRGDLDWIAMKAMEKDRSRRYGSVAELAADVEHHLAGAPVAAAPPSRVYRLRKFVRRHRTGVVSASAVGAAVVMGAVGIGLASERALLAERARERLAAHVEGQRLMLRDLLEGARPSIALGRDTTMLRAALDAAAERIRRGDLRDAPEAELDHRMTIGDAYREIGQFRAAHDMLDTLPDLAASIAGAESIEHANALAVRASLLRTEGNLDASLADAQSALDIRRRVASGDRADLAKNIQEVGDSLFGLGRYDEALAFQQEALAMRRRLFPGDHPDVALSLSSAGEVLRALWRLDDALAHHQQALAMYRALEAGNSLNVALASNNVAVCLSDLGRASEAIGPQREALEMFRRLYPDGHPFIVNGLGNLAGCLQDTGRLDEALPQYEAALAMSQRLFAGDHPGTAVCLNNLAFCLDAMGRPGDALSPYTAALDMLRRLSPEGHPQIPLLLGNIGRTLHLLGRLDESIESYERALAEASGGLPEDDPRVARLHSNFGWCLVESGRLAEAETHLLWAQQSFDAAEGIPPRFLRENIARLVEVFEKQAPSSEAAQAKAAEWRRRLAELDAGQSAGGDPGGGG
ncbi:MAG: hypothetical protein BroJett004_25240 [Planctomycetota bacterium]|nr:serine/threonine protein kinase [Phycisphaerales bacterium]GIK20360.1 MAG: hypothetical protein BroJett004_25240 [Planctomycetota bacterium]